MWALFFSKKKTITQNQLTIMKLGFNHHAKRNIRGYY